MNTKNQEKIMLEITKRYNSKREKTEAKTLELLIKTGWNKKDENEAEAPYPIPNPYTEKIKNQVAEQMILEPIFQNIAKDDIDFQIFKALRVLRKATIN